MASEFGQRKMAKFGISGCQSGETKMATIRKEMHLNAPTEKVWSALADFQHVHTRLAPGFVVDSKPDGDNVRTIRFANGSIVKETLVTLEKDRHRLVYFVTSERISHHNASAEIIADGKDRCRFVWTTDVLPDELAPYIDSQMSEGAKAMKAALEGA
jgi:uncharacterized protein YndB with AHSA1/START domain